MTASKKNNSQLIVAIATPPGKGGIGIIRIAGDGIDKLMQKILDKPAVVGQVCKRTFLDKNKQSIDFGIALLFKAPHSYTGDDVLELHGHGSPAVMQTLLYRCIELGARIAQPGEFTLRAHLANKLDLAQAEAVADLINASSTRAAKLAKQSLAGELSKRANEITTDLTEIRSQLEASIDFDDEDISPATAKQLDQLQQKLIKKIQALLTDCASSLKWQQVATVAIVGVPNTGKSSLLNALSKTDAAIVSDTPGTTRDIVSTGIEINGLHIKLQDTAGLHQSDEHVEQEGMRRAKQAASDADLVIWVTDVTKPSQPKPTDNADIIVHNKIDLTKHKAKVKQNEVWLSAKTEQGLKLLTDLLAQLAGLSGEEPPFLARQRHVTALEIANTELKASRKANLPEQQAEHLREAAFQIGSITGMVTNEDLLGEIFSKFCIGK